MMNKYPFKVKCEIIITSIRNEMLFECDPKLNTECKKTACGTCKHTKDIRFAKRFDIDEQDIS